MGRNIFAVGGQGIDGRLLDSLELLNTFTSKQSETWHILGTSPKLARMVPIVYSITHEKFCLFGGEQLKGDSLSEREPCVESQVVETSAGGIEHICTF